MRHGCADSHMLVVVLVLSCAGVFLWAYMMARKRREDLRLLALSQGMLFSERGSLPADTMEQLYSNGHRQTVTNMLSGMVGGREGRFLDFSYTVGYGKNSRTYSQTVALLKMAQPVPGFMLRPENFLDKIAEKFGGQDFDFGDSPGFSSKYRLRGADENAVRAFFTPALRGQLEGMAPCCLFGNGSWLGFYRSKVVVKPALYAAFIGEASMLADIAPRADGIF